MAINSVSLYVSRIVVRILAGYSHIGTYILCTLYDLEQSIRNMMSDALLSELHALLKVGKGAWCKLNMGCRI